MSAAESAAEQPDRGPPPRLALALLACALLAGGGAISAGRVASSAALDRVEAVEAAGTAQMELAEDHGILSEIAARDPERRDKDEDTLRTLLADNVARSSREQAQARRGVEAALRAERRVAPWRDGLVVLAAVLFAATLLAGMADRARPVRWAAAALGAAATLGVAWAKLADLLGATR